MDEINENLAKGQQKTRPPGQVCILEEDQGNSDVVGRQEQEHKRGLRAPPLGPFVLREGDDRSHQWLRY